MKVGADGALPIDVGIDERLSVVAGIDDERLLATKEYEKVLPPGLDGAVLLETERDGE